MHSVCRQAQSTEYIRRHRVLLMFLRDNKRPALVNPCGLTALEGSHKN